MSTESKHGKESYKDDQYSGRPTTAVTDETIAAATKMV